VTVSVLKLGGELLESESKLAAAARAIVRSRAAGPLVVVHGGGREIDAALAKNGLAKRQVDGLRITDAETLEVVVSVLAGLINTRFVAAINAAGGRAVGLTGADAGVAPVKAAPPHRATNGDIVDLGLVGEPMRSVAPRVLTTLCGRGFVPIVACIGASKSGQLFNVNADTMAGSLAARLKARRLVIAGGTAGVLDEQGKTIPSLAPRDIAALVRSGTASAGMVAKLTACQGAAKSGVKDVTIVDGRNLSSLAAALMARGPMTASLVGTRITS
jgi:acetylglutamate kinase